MKKLLVIFLLSSVCAYSAVAQQIYDFSVKNESGDDVSLTEYKGRVLLIVNTATQCGFTPQYKELEALYAKYHAQGLEILDFPCNQFGEQAPGSIQQIHQFCTANFDIQFPQFDKIDVNGPDAHPLFTYLKAQKGFAGFDTNTPTGRMMDEMLCKRDANYDQNSDIKWNFTKFLVDSEGNVIRRYEPTEDLNLVENDICKYLNPTIRTIMTRTSIRQYSSQPVSKSQVEMLLRAGMAAPTAVNRQPWHFVVVTNREKLVSLGAGRNRMLEQCPLAIVVCGNLEKALSGQAQEYWVQDCSAATQNILLAAHALGLGAVWTGVYPIDQRVSTVSSLLQLPDTLKPLCVIAIGYPAESPMPKDKWQPENVTSVE